MEKTIIKELFMARFNDLTEVEKIEVLTEIVNDGNSWNGSFEDLQAFSMDDFNDLMDGKDPLDILDSVDKDFNTSDDLFKDTIYGLVSMDENDYEKDLLENQEEILNTFLDDDSLQTNTTLSDELLTSIIKENFGYLVGDEVNTFDNFNKGIQQWEPKDPDNFRTVVKPVYNDYSQDFDYLLSDGTVRESQDLFEI